MIYTTACIGTDTNGYVFGDYYQDSAQGYPAGTYVVIYEDACYSLCNSYYLDRKPVGVRYWRSWALNESFTWWRLRVQVMDPSGTIVYSEARSLWLQA
ncbi:hypothetical protein J5X84_04295 [Streptosporangiaceae bacterium NEAU-GS5]|nr:hypothetical protein [Streptosporangiaceae bacterium NEAU-GS5]